MIKYLVAFTTAVVAVSASDGPGPVSPNPPIKPPLIDLGAILNIMPDFSVDDASSIARLLLELSNNQFLLQFMTTAGSAESISGVEDMTKSLVSLLHDPKIIQMLTRIEADPVGTLQELENDPEMAKTIEQVKLVAQHFKAIKMVFRNNPVLHQEFEQLLNDIFARLISGEIKLDGLIGAMIHAPAFRELSLEADQIFRLENEGGAAHGSDEMADLAR